VHMDRGSSAYTMVLPVRHFRLDDNRVAIESAFAEHLRMMRLKVGALGGRLLVASPSMSQTIYETGRSAYTIIEERQEEVFFCTLFSDNDSSVQRKTNICLRLVTKFFSSTRQIRLWKPLLTKLFKLVDESFCVHSGPSHAIFLPFEFVSILIAVLKKKCTVFVVDIDYRNSPLMSYRAGSWSLRSYFLSKYVYHAALSLQVWVAAK